MTVCFHFLKYGSHIVITSQKWSLNIHHLYSSYVKDLFIWLLSSSTAFGACVWPCGFSAGIEHRSISPGCHHPDVCLALHSRSREEADRQTALQVHVCSLQSPAGESPIGRHSQHQSQIVNQASLCDPIHKILGVLRRKQRRMTSLTQLLCSLDILMSPGLQHPKVSLMVNFPDIL